MKNVISCILLFFVLSNIHSQETIYKKFISQVLNKDRDIKIQLPENYNESSKKYPIILVLDGDYMFEIVSGNVLYHAYWEEIPESIVVGVNQIDDREEDIMYDPRNSFPTKESTKFFDFIGTELIPYIEKKYRTANFKVAVGHGKTANFINYYLFKENPLFNAYIAISPDLAPEIGLYLKEKLTNVETKTFYYLGTSKGDVSIIKETTEALDNQLNKIENENLFYSYDKFDNISHYRLPQHSIPKGLKSIFSIFAPITKKEYKEKILPLETSPVDYLIEKYKTIADLLTLDKTPMLVNDFRAIEAAIKKTDRYEFFEQLGNLAKKENPKLLLGHYYLGRFHLKQEKYKKAIKNFEAALLLEEAGSITKDLVSTYLEELKVDQAKFYALKEAEKEDKKEAKEKEKEIRNNEKELKAIEKEIEREKERTEKARQKLKEANKDKATDKD